MLAVGTCAFPRIRGAPTGRIADGLLVLRDVLDEHDPVVSGRVGGVKWGVAVVGGYAGGGRRVERLDQTYRRLDDRRYDYTSEGGDFRAVLDYDAAGLIVNYPGIAVRFA